MVLMFLTSYYMVAMRIPRVILWLLVCGVLYQIIGPIAFFISAQWTSSSAQGIS